MKRNLLLAFLAAGWCGGALAQNATDDFPNVPPGAALAIMSNGTASAAGRINSSTDVDVFNFFVATRSVLTVYTTGNTDTNGVLRKPGSMAAGTMGWTTVATEEGGTGNFRISRTVEPGQYSIQVGGKVVNTAASEYGLRVELTPANTPPADIDVPGAARGSVKEMGTVDVGGRVTRTFVVGNTGGSTLNITSIGLWPNNPTLVAIPFAVDGGAARSIAPGASSSFTVVFQPALGGRWEAGIRIVSSDPDENPWDFQVVGTARLPEPTDAPEIAAALGNADLMQGGTVNFGAVMVPSNADVVREIVVFNKGTADLNLGSVKLELLPLGSPLPSAPEGFFKILTQPAPVVAPGRSTVVRFGAGMTTAPAALMTRYAVHAILENNDADENPFRLTLTAEPKTTPPAGAPEIGVAAGDTALADDGSFSMGSTATGSPLTKSFVISNTGDANLNISGIMVVHDGPVIAIWPPPPLPFTVVSQGIQSITPGASAEFRVVFNSTVAGEFSALLNVGSNDADENPFSVTLRAKAEGSVPPQAPEIGVSSEGADLPAGGLLDFGRTSLTVAVRRTITVANTGAGPLNVRFGFQPLTRSNTTVPMFFRFATVPFTTVPAGSSKPLTIAFQPMVAGTFETVLLISNNDADENPYRIRLKGIGGTDANRVPEIALSLGGADLPLGALVDFGSANPRTSVTREIRIANTGTGDLRLGRFTLSRPAAVEPAAGANDAAGIMPPVPAPLPFRVLPPPNGIVPAGGAATLRVVYMAPASGTHEAVLSMESNDADENPYKLKLLGKSTGTAPAPAEIAVSTGGADLPIGGELSFGSVVTGTPVRRTVTISNTGSGELRISSFYIMPAFTAGGIDAMGGFMPTVAVARVVSGVTVIAPGASGDFVLELIGFAPGEAKLLARIGNNDADENPYTFMLSATVEAPPVVDPPVLIGPPIIIIQN